MHSEPHLVPFQSAELVAEPDNSLTLKALLKRDDSDTDTSITWVRLQGTHRWVRSTSATRIYYVIEGRGEFEFEGGEEAIEAKPGDLLVIPLDLFYRLRGPVTYLVINRPGFQPGDDEYLDSR